MKKGIIIIVILATLCAAAVAASASAVKIFGFINTGDVQVSSGNVLFGIGESCTAVTILAGQTNKVILTIPARENFNNIAPTVVGIGVGSLVVPKSAYKVRYWYGAPRLKLATAAGSGKTVTLKLTAKCIEATNGVNTIADIDVAGTAETLDESAEWTCQDSTFPSPVTIAYTSTAGVSTGAPAQLCYKYFVALDPCPGYTVAAETEARCLR